MIIAAPILAVLQWGLAGLLTIVAIAAAWHGGMVWEAIRRKPNQPFRTITADDLRDSH